MWAQNAQKKIKNLDRRYRSSSIGLSATRHEASSRRRGKLEGCGSDRAVACAERWYLRAQSSSLQSPPWNAYSFTMKTPPLSSCWACSVFSAPLPPPPKTLGEQMEIDNPRAITYLATLKDSDVGKKVKGVKLSDRSTVELKGAEYHGSKHLPAKKQHIYLFRDEDGVRAYVWIDAGGKQLKVPPDKSAFPARALLHSLRRYLYLSHRRARRWTGYFIRRDARVVCPTEMILSARWATVSAAG